jgi:hypothetical protein
VELLRMHHVHVVQVKNSNAAMESLKFK